MIGIKGEKGREYLEGKKREVKKSCQLGNA